MVNGYFPEDTNLDGVVKYARAGNDRDPILVNTLGAIVSPPVFTCGSPNAVWGSESGINPAILRSSFINPVVGSCTLDHCISGK